MALIYLLLIFIISNCIKNIFKIDNKYTILLATAFIYITLYVFGILNILLIGNYFIYLMCIAGCIYLTYKLVKKQMKLKDLVSPTYIYYLIIALIIYVAVIHCKFNQWDEFSHWGTNLKFMFYKNQLWASRVWEGVHEGYPPLAGIIEYFVLKLNNSYDESIAFFALDLFMLSLLSPMLKSSFKITDIIKNLLFILSVYMCILIFGFSINSTYIDLPLALLFACGFYIAVTMTKETEKITLAIVLFMLPIFKDSGVIMAGVILLYLFFDAIHIYIKNKKFDFRILIPLIKYFIIVCTAYFTWKLYCGLNGTVIDFRHDSNAISTFNIVEYLKSLLLLSVSKNYDITTYFYDFLNNGGIIAKYPFQTIIQIIVFINIVMISMYYFKITDKDRMKKIILSLNTGVIIYILFLLLVYLFVMLEPEGRSLASFPRYIGTYFIAWLVVIFSICLNNKKSWTPIIICFLVCLYGTNLLNFKPFSKNVDIIPREDYYMYDSINQYLSNNDKVFIVLQNNDGGLFHPLRYLLSPIQTNLLYEWHLGDNNSSAYLAVFNLSSDEFVQELEARKYTHVYLGIVDEEFVDKYGSLFDSEPTVDGLTNKLYKFEAKKNNYRFFEVN